MNGFLKNIKIILCIVFIIFALFILSGMIIKQEIEIQNMIYPDKCMFEIPKLNEAYLNQLPVPRR